MLPKQIWNYAHFPSWRLLPISNIQHRRQHENRGLLYGCWRAEDRGNCWWVDTDQIWIRFTPEQFWLAHYSVQWCITICYSVVKMKTQNSNDFYHDFFNVEVYQTTLNLIRNILYLWLNEWLEASVFLY